MEECMEYDGGLLIMEKYMLVKKSDMDALELELELLKVSNDLELLYIKIMCENIEKACDEVIEVCREIQGEC